jgi:hypothetical protein
MRIRLLTFLVAFLMLLSMVACNNSNPETGGKDEEKTTEDLSNQESSSQEQPGGAATEPVWGDGYLDSDHPTYGYDEFTILTRPENQYSDSLVISTIEPTSTSLERAVYERTVSIEEEYQIKFKIATQFLWGCANTLYWPACLGSVHADTCVAMVSLVPTTVAAGI